MSRRPLHFPAAVCVSAGLALTATGGGVYHATVTIDPARKLGAISPLIYGQYLEHVQAADECIYPAIWDGASKLADALGLRRDVVDAARELAVHVVRWPGGCFADTYHWENGTGPRAARPVLPNQHWGGTESHQFGTDEFLRWCELTGAQPYLNVNLGSGTLEEALRWLEYCNGVANSTQGRRRRANGRVAPYDVLFWGIGNETWGSWATGHTDAATYAQQLARWAGAMRLQDPRIKILAVGSDEGNEPAWDRAVLERAAGLIDFLTLHTYGLSTDAPDEYEAVAFTPAYMEDRMRKMLATIDDAAPARAQAVRLAIDEWNIRRYEGRKLTRRAPRNLQDAIFAAGVLNAMVRLSPRIGMANYVFLANGHAPLLVDADRIVRTPLFHVFRRYALGLQGQSLALDVQAPKRLPPAPLTARPGRALPGDYQPKPVSLLDAAGALHDDGEIVVSFVNRHPTEQAVLELKLPAGYAIASSWTLHDDDVRAANTFDAPRRVVPIERAVDQRGTAWTCPPHSIVLLTCRKP